MTWFIDFNLIKNLTTPDAIFLKKFFFNEPFVPEHFSRKKNFRVKIGSRQTFFMKEFSGENFLVLNIVIGTNQQEK